MAPHFFICFFSFFGLFSFPPFSSFPLSLPSTRLAFFFISVCVCVCVCVSVSAFTLRCTHLSLSLSIPTVVCSAVNASLWRAVEDAVRPLPSPLLMISLWFFFVLGHLCFSPPFTFFWFGFSFSLVFCFVCSSLVRTFFFLSSFFVTRFSVHCALQYLNTKKKKRTRFFGNYSAPLIFFLPFFFWSTRFLLCRIRFVDGRDLLENMWVLVHRGKHAHTQKNPSKKKMNEWKKAVNHLQSWLHGPFHVPVLSCRLSPFSFFLHCCFVVWCSYFPLGIAREWAYYVSAFVS